MALNCIIPLRVDLRTLQDKHQTHILLSDASVPIALRLGRLKEELGLSVAISPDVNY